MNERRESRVVSVVVNIVSRVRQGGSEVERGAEGDHQTDDARSASTDRLCSDRHGRSKQITGV